MPKTNVVTIVVLNDGETFTDLNGSRVVEIPRAAWKKAEKAGETDELVKQMYYDKGREIRDLWNANK